MDFRYDNYGDAEQQLHLSVVMTSDGPVYLRWIEDWTYTVYYLSSGIREEQDIREIGLTFAPMNLGYINYNSSLFYLKRDPKRMWKAGITEDNTRALGGWFDKDVMRSYDLYQTIMNIYPSIQECYDIAIATGGAKAFHRDFAFLGKSVVYKGETIGDILPDGSLNIHSEFEFVKEQLEELVA